MRILSSLLLVSSLTAVAHAGYGPVTPPYTLTPKARVDNAINDYKATNAFKGAVVVVIDHGTRYQFFYGSRDAAGTPFDHSTALHIGSNTKTLTATALAYVDYYGILSRWSLLKSQVVINPASPPFTATLMDLADHRSGLPRTDGDPGSYATVDDLMASLNHCATWSPSSAACKAPGQMVYSNYGYQILGNVISDRLGFATWAEMNEDLITGPLAMTKTCVHGDGCNPGFNANHAHPFSFAGTELTVDDGDPVAAPSGGSLWSTADDMTTWLRYNLGEATTANSHALDLLRPELLTTGPGNTGFAWNFKPNTFSDGASSQIRWKDGRVTGLVSYIGLADSRDTAVFVFVNQDPIASTSDPNDDGPGVPVQQLGVSILSQFP